MMAIRQIKNPIRKCKYCGEKHEGYVFGVNARPRDERGAFLCDPNKLKIYQSKGGE